MRTNVKNRNTLKTHEGAPAVPVSPLANLRRSVLSCLLWEDEFYEDGVEIGKRIVELARQTETSALSALAVEARKRFYLRHVPLLLLSVLAERKGRVVADTIDATITRADELAEFLAVHARKEGVTPDKIKPKLSNQMRKGLARAFGRFNEYKLAKYNRDHAVKLRDVLFLCHAKPKDDEQKALWTRLINDELAIPATWEVLVSAAKGDAEKTKAAWTHLLAGGDEGRSLLGDLAFMRNLRNMDAAGISHDLIAKGFESREWNMVYPFRFVAAARVCPWAEPWLDQAMQKAIRALPKLKGTTAVLVDVSGSMDAKLSGKSDLTRMDAGAALASIVNGERLRVFSFSERVKEVPARPGMAGIEAVVRSQQHGGTYLGAAVKFVNETVECSRLIVVSDEQSHDPVPEPKMAHAYMVNVASNRNGVGYRGKWNHIDGFSENVLRWIHEYEQSQPIADVPTAETRDDGNGAPGTPGYFSFRD